MSRRPPRRVVVRADSLRAERAGVRGHPPNLRGARDELGAAGDATSNERGGPGAASATHRRHPRKPAGRRAGKRFRPGRSSGIAESAFLIRPFPFQNGVPAIDRNQFDARFPFRFHPSRFHLRFNRARRRARPTFRPVDLSPATLSHARDASLGMYSKNHRSSSSSATPPTFRGVDPRTASPSRRRTVCRLQLFPRVIRHQRSRQHQRRPRQGPDIAPAWWWRAPSPSALCPYKTSEHKTTSNVPNASACAASPQRVARPRRYRRRSPRRLFGEGRARREVRETTRFAPRRAATMPGRAGPHPSSTTVLPRITSGLSARYCAMGAAASQTHARWRRGRRPGSGSDARTRGYRPGRGVRRRSCQPRGSRPQSCTPRGAGRGGSERRGPGGEKTVSMSRRDRVSESVGGRVGREARAAVRRAGRGEMRVRDARGSAPLHLRGWTRARRGSEI